MKQLEIDSRGAPMSRYLARDLLRVPGLLSLLRIPLAASFPFVAGEPLAALAVLAAAGITDVLDGWYARRFGQVTPTGCAIDPITDKLFVLTVASTLVARDQLSIGAVVLLSTRELGELPLVLWLALNSRARAAMAEHPAANVPGKIATVLQFTAVSAVLLEAPSGPVWVIATAAAGVYAALAYWKRALAIASKASN
jgi:cardiolipin synthase